ncbi:MAG TPA: hypothetical protein VK968_05835 [Roseimicrobium sp.]|nr:hypothetical protein [Roseimicrobium sp.]
MNLTRWILISLAANAVLGVICFRPDALKRATVRQTTTANGLTNTQRRTVNRVIEVAAPAEIVRLDWKKIESPDYHEYITRLREAACPEQTIRDIIVSDVQKLYAQKWRAGRQSPPKTEWVYWQGDKRNDWERKYYNPAQRADAILKGRLQREKEALLEELLGVDEADETFAGQFQDQRQSPLAKLDFLGKEKAMHVRSIQRRWQRLLADFGEAVDFGDGWTPEKHREEKTMRRQMDDEIAEYLGSADKLEFDLRFSDSARNLRNQVSGFNFTEEEFRKLFAIQQSYDRQRLLIDEDPNNKAARKQAAELAKLNQEQLKAALDPERQLEFERSRNYEYSQTIGFAQANDLPREAAGQILEVKTAAQSAILKIQTNNGLSADQKKEILAQMRAETEKTLSGMIGPDNLKVYRSSTGQWLKYDYR